MALESLEVKERLAAFGLDLNTLCNELYAAMTDEAPTERRTSLIARARTKSAQYDELLATLSAPQRSEAESLYGDDVETMRGFVAQLGG